jgi:hypothetical protein
MKNLVLLVALALFALTVPASAAETAKGAPAVTSPSQAAAFPDLARIIKPVPGCAASQGTSCTTLGSTMACTDVCHDKLSCTCVSSFSNPSVHVWSCQAEC